MRRIYLAGIIALFVMASGCGEDSNASSSAGVTGGSSNPSSASGGTNSGAVSGGAGGAKSGGSVSGSGGTTGTGTTGTGTGTGTGTSTTIDENTCNQGVQCPKGYWCEVMKGGCTRHCDCVDNAYVCSNSCQSDGGKTDAVATPVDGGAADGQDVVSVPTDATLSEPDAAPAQGDASSQGDALVSPSDGSASAADAAGDS